MSVDMIRTRPLAASGHLSIPFDWEIGLAPDSDCATTNMLLPCQGAVITVERLATLAPIPEETLDTAVIHSLFTDRRAGDDDKLPLNVTDRRGWCGDGIVCEQGDHYGSLLWLVLSGKQEKDKPARAKFYAEEALQWMIDKGIASKVEAIAWWERMEVMALQISITRPNELAPGYDVVWGLTLGDRK